MLFFNVIRALIEMFIYTDDIEEDEKFTYSPKYGLNLLNSTAFDDHSLLGEDYYQYKPEKILIWTNQDNRISGIQTWFKNVIDSKSINSGENKGTESLNLHEFVINPSEYLSDCEIWSDNTSITYINLKTNKDKAFPVGIKKGNKQDINILTNAKKEKIIISFFGSYNNLMNGFGFHLIDKSEYFRILL